MELKIFTSRYRPDHEEKINRISTRAMPKEEHIMRALDVYLSLASIRQLLEATEPKPADQQELKERQSV